MSFSRASMEKKKNKVDPHITPVQPTAVSSSYWLRRAFRRRRFARFWVSLKKRCDDAIGAS